MKQNLLLALLSITVIGYSQSFKIANTTTVSCNLIYQTTIETFDVYKHSPSNFAMYKAKFAVDADGSPRAYGPNNSGLDWTANAGSPGNWWGVVTDVNGNPILQTASNPYPGMYVSTTSLVNSQYASTNPLHYTNSETVPFFVIPTAVRNLFGIVIGDVAYVYNTVTGLGRFAIYADSGPAGKLGEGSIYLANQIGLNSSPKTGGTSSGIIDYIIFPNSGFGQGKIPTIAQIDSIGNAKIAFVGGTGITSCLASPVDNIAPVTSISTPNIWDTTNFVATFTDVDNTNGSGVEKSFYQITDYNNSNEWRANNTKGFFNDDFNGTTIHPDWIVKTGVWNMNSNVLQQTDETNSNTNMYAALTQTLSNRYLYNWTGSINGSGTSRRAGFHFFCDAPDSANRGNSYFVYFRLDGSRIQIYKVTNNSWGAGPVKDTAYSTFAANQNYDFKISYDRTTGIVKVYVNDVLSAQWTDASPIATGTHISFRSGNCIYKVDNFKVFRSRNATATISVGAGSTNYIRFQNQNPTSPAAKINSIITDAAGNLSSVITKDINIDWTNPSVVSYLNDGVSADIDTTANGTQLQANWVSAIDVNSNIKNYYYAIGTTPGASNIKAWTTIPSGSTTSITVTGLTLVQSQKYYVSLQSENFATMRSSSITTDGQVYYTNVATSVKNIDNEFDLNIFPNPNNGQFEINYSYLTNHKTEVKVLDVLGKVVYQTELSNNKALIDLNTQSPGIYYVVLKSENKLITKKIVIEK